LEVTLKIGTKSVLFGAHCFFIHPFFVLWAWTKLYGFPLDPRIICAIFLHDIGYIGLPNMDGIEGERHPEVAAKLMTRLFDRARWYPKAVVLKDGSFIGPWGQFVLFHSRHYTRLTGGQVSRLCYADKLTIALTPTWLYIPLVRASGELAEYMELAKEGDSSHWTPITSNDVYAWHSKLRKHMQEWVEQHRDGTPDTWTRAHRHA
jgi:hypothetical protein